MAKGKTARPRKLCLGDHLENPMDGKDPDWQQDGDTFDVQTAMSRLRVFLNREKEIADQHTKEKILPLLVLDGKDYSTDLSKEWTRKWAYVTSVDLARAVHRTFDGSYCMIKRKIRN